MQDLNQAPAPPAGMGELQPSAQELCEKVSAQTTKALSGQSSEEESVGHSKDRTEGKVHSVSAHITKISQINNLMMYCKLLEKQEQTKTKPSRWSEIMKIRAEINDIDTKKL
jgi:hypothetical protein